MALVTDKPSLKYFKYLPDIGQAARTFRSINAENLIGNLGEIFLKHSVYNEYGLILLHRHFSMNEDEILVETFNKQRNLSIACPWIIDGDYAYPTNLALINGNSLVPEKFIVNQSYAITAADGSTAAYEYLSHSTELSAPPKEFTADLHAALTSYGIESVLGIRRLHDLQENCCWETTPEGIRANITHYTLDPPIEALDTNMIEVIFSFDLKGEFDVLENADMWNVLRVYVSNTVSPIHTIFKMHPFHSRF